MADENQNCRIESEEKDSMERNGGRKRKSRWDEKPHISEALMQPSIDLWYNISGRPDDQKELFDILQKIDDEKERAAALLLGRMWDEDAVPEFLKDLGVEELDPEMRALNCQLIALEKQHLASECNDLAKVSLADRQMVVVVDEMLKKTREFSQLPLSTTHRNTLTEAVAVEVVVRILHYCTRCRFWLRRCDVPLD